MSYYRDELAMVAENRDPIPFEEAVVRGTEGRKFVFVLPTVEFAKFVLVDIAVYFLPLWLRRSGTGTLFFR